MLINQKQLNKEIIFIEIIEHSMLFIYNLRLEKSCISKITFNNSEEDLHKPCSRVEEILLKILK